MEPGKPNLSGVGKVVTVSVLLSASAVSAYNALTKLPPTPQASDPPSPDTEAKKIDAQKISQPTQLSAKRAIAQPEKLLSPQKAPKMIQTAGTKPTLDSDSFARKALARSSWMRQYDSSSRLPNLNAATRAAVSPPETMEVGDRGDDPNLPTTRVLRDIEGHWAQYQIDYLAARRIVQGFPDGSFHPDRAVTAGEFATLMQKAFPNGDLPISYRDWQASSANSVTRADVAVLIYRNLVKREPQMIVTNVRIQGEVARPGGYSLAAASDVRLGSGNNIPTVARAIQQAGGNLGNANLHQVEIHRVTETGSEKVIKVNVANSAEAGDRGEDIVLQQNDKLVIPANPASAQQPTDPNGLP